jgi:C_GCAxxG_C_C family probable redox protein
MSKSDNKIDDYIKKAINYFSLDYNCAQSVFGAFSEVLGLDPSDALKIATGFGGGMGLNGKTCGAVSGALMVIGLKYGKSEPNDQTSKDHTYTLVNDFISEFSKKYGTVECKELLGIDISNPEEFDYAKKSNYFEDKCPNFVRDATIIVKRILFHEKE